MDDLIAFVRARLDDDERVARATVPPGLRVEDCPWSVNVRLLGLPYADHPDYREEWKPNG